MESEGSGRSLGERDGSLQEGVVLEDMGVWKEETRGWKKLRAQKKKV